MMNEHYILSIDSGVSTGIALGRYSDTEPYRLVQCWQFSGGLEGVLQWLEYRFHFEDCDAPYGHRWDFALDDGTGEPRILLPHEVTVISEKFQPINHSNYALTTKSVEPLRIEGALIALLVMPDYPHKTWRRPQDMYIFGGNDLASKKKAGADFLKRHDMLVTGKNVGAPDANDARSAIWHGVSYLVKEVKHKPTFDLLTEEK